MDHPTSPSPCDLTAKRQRRISHDAEDENKAQSHQQQSSDGAASEAEVSVRTPRSLTAEFMKLINYNDALATPALKLLDLYFCLWECYVLKSAEKIRLEDEQRQLRESTEWLASDSDILLQVYNGQALILLIPNGQFKHFVTASFRPCKRAIFKPIMLMGLDEVLVLSGAREDNDT